MFLIQEIKKETGKGCNSKTQSLGMFVFIPNSEKIEVKGTDPSQTGKHLCLISDADFCWHSRIQVPEAQSTVPAQPSRVRHCH